MDGVDKFGRPLHKRYGTNHSIRIPDPTIDTDPVNKIYVDNTIQQCNSKYERIKSYITDNCLTSNEKFADEDFSGDFYFDANNMRIHSLASPFEATDAVNLHTLEKYVQDNAVMHSADQINFRSSRVSNIGDAEKDEDAVNLGGMKQFCDEMYGFFQVSIQSSSIPKFWLYPHVPTFA